MRPLFCEGMMDYYTVKTGNELQLALATIADQQAQIARLQQDAVALRVERDGLRDRVYDLLSMRHGSLDARPMKCNETMGQDND